MKYAVLVDSMSNMPEHVLKTRKNILQIPLNIRIGKTRLIDITQTEALRQFYKNNLLESDTKADATSPSAEQFTVHLLNDVVTKYDTVFFQSTSTGLSAIYQIFKGSIELIEKEAMVMRKMAGSSQTLQVAFSNTGTSSSGQTLVALYSDALLSKGTSLDECIKNTDQFKKTVRTYSVIKDILYARNRMKDLGFKTVSLATAVSGQIRSYAPIIKISNDRLKIKKIKIKYNRAISQLFAYAEDCIDSGLHLPIIHVSYAGRIRELHAMKSFRSLQNKAKKNGITLLSGMMNASACINYSVGSVSLGIAPKDQESDPI